MVSEDKQQILDIKVKYEDAIYGIIRYKEKIDQLKQSIKDLQQQEKDKTITTNEMKLQTEAINATIKEYQYNVRTLQKEIQNNVRTENEQEGSLKQLRAQLSNATKKYDEMAKAEREGAKGQALQKHINDITQELKLAEEQTQRYYRNVGNYYNSMLDLAEDLQHVVPMGGGGGVGEGISSFANTVVDLGKNVKGIIPNVKAFGSTLIGLATNPVFLGLAGVVGAGVAFKWWYDYNKGLMEATRLTQQFTGLTGNEMKSVRNEVLAVSDTFGLDFKETMQSANTMSKAFGISVSESLKIMQDGLVSGANANGEFLDTIKEYPRYFKEAGLSAEEMVAISTQATKEGIFSDKGVDTIKEGNLRLREMTTATAAALDGIGISSKQVQKDLQDGSKTTFQVMQEVANKLKELPQSSAAVGSAIADIFGGPGEDAGLAYIEMLGDVELNMDKVKAKSGDIAKAQEDELNATKELQNAMASLFDYTGGGFETMKAQLSTIAKKSLTAVIKGVIQAINYFIDWYNESLLFRGLINAIAINFRLMWNAVKLVCNLVIDSFKRMGFAAKGMLDILEGIVTFDLSKAQKGFKEIFDLSGTIKEVWHDIKNAGIEIGNSFADGFENTVNGRLEHLKLVGVNGGATSSEPVSGNKGTTPAAKGSTTKTKAQKGEADQRKREQDEIRKAEDLMQQLIGDSAEKQRQIIVLSYDRRISDIRKKLATEKKLTVMERKALNVQIEALEKLKQRDLAKLDAEQLQKDVEFENKRISLILSTIKKGSDQERDLKIKELDNKEKLDIAQATKDYANEEQRQQMILAIQKSYQAQREQIEKDFYNSQLNAQEDAIKKEFEKKILESTVSDPEGNNELERLRLEMEEARALMESARQMEGETDEEFYMRKLELEADFQKKQQDYIKAETSLKEKKLEALKNVIGSVQEVLEAFGEDNEALAKAAKIITLAEIAFNTSKALSAGIASASSLPYPYNLVAIATTVATILTNIARAKKIFSSAKFSTGGYVHGAGTGTSDSIPARLSNGESVMTAKATSMFSPILSAFNQLGGGVPIVANNGGSNIGMDMLAAAVARGYQMAPQPVVSVEEINRTQRRVQTIENISRL